MKSCRMHFFVLVIGLLVQLPHSVRPSDEDIAGHAKSDSTHHASSQPGVLPRASRKHPAPTRIAVGKGSGLVALSGVKRSGQHRQESSLTHHSHVSEPVPASNESALADEGVNITSEWMHFLFDLIDTDGSGKVGKNEWTEIVKGSWAEPLWEGLDTDNSAEIGKSEFEDWDAAVESTFKKLGGADGSIAMKEIDEFTATDYEKDFAKSPELIGDDKDMDIGDFEEFLYTAIAFRAMNPNGDESITWDEAEKNPGAKGKFNSKETFEKTFGEKMKIADLHKYFEDNGVFGEAKGSGSVRSGLAYAVLAIVAACAW